MTIASDLLQRHIQTLVDDNAQWQTLIADDILWELAYKPERDRGPRQLRCTHLQLGSRFFTLDKKWHFALNDPTDFIGAWIGSFLEKGSA
jgi:hypothetical protein